MWDVGIFEHVCRQIMDNWATGVAVLMDMKCFFFSHTMRFKFVFFVIFNTYVLPIFQGSAEIHLKCGALLQHNLICNAAQTVNTFFW